MIPYFKIILLFLSSILICLTQQISQSDTMVLSGVLFDQFPEYNNNFEPKLDQAGIENSKVVERMVNQMIDPKTRVPTHRFDSNLTTINRNGRIVSPNLFKYFFQSNLDAPKAKNSGLNYPINVNLTLKLDEKTGVYVYQSKDYFPVDNLGFDSDPLYRVYKNENGVYHNYHFCLKVNTMFTYKGYETFSFIGDDDVWVYINDALVVDLGGLHTPANKSIDLTKLDLKKGSDYKLDFFYCERHTTLSTIKIETTIQTVCNQKDYCGVCYGDGSTCCSPKTCDDGNPCTTDSCPPFNTKIEEGVELKEYCEHFEIDCPFINHCTNSSCNPSNGKCESTTIVCKDKTDQCFNYKSNCQTSQTCAYETTCNDICHTGICAGKGKCQIKSGDDCARELGNDPCKEYFCDSKLGGCGSRPKCPQNVTDECGLAICVAGICSTKQSNKTECECGCDKVKNKCVKSSCVDSKCVYIPLSDDGNMCTQDYCDPNTGIVTHTPINSNCTGCMKCNALTGSCSPVSSNCNDGNECTDDICLHDELNPKSGICKSIDKVCSSLDKCKQFSCNNETGCVSSNVVCPNDGNCLVGVCDSVKGCTLQPRSCKSKAFCIVSSCDERLGCLTYDKTCVADDPKCQGAICINGTSPTDGKCKSIDFDPKPFMCQRAAIISTAVIAGVVVAGVVALAAAIFASKKGYDYWKSTQGNTFTSSNNNPLYEVNPKARADNPLYVDEK